MISLYPPVLPFYLDSHSSEYETSSFVNLGFCGTPDIPHDHTYFVATHRTQEASSTPTRRAQGHEPPAILPPSIYHLPAPQATRSSPPSRGASQVAPAHA